MNTGGTQSIHSKDSNATESFGEQLGRNLRGGEVIELISDLGGGKTTLARGIARGAGSSDVVGSPTFMISKVYKTPRFDIYHYDFYRLTAAGVLEHELHDTLGDSQVVALVEWGEIVQDVLPDPRFIIHINKTSDDKRELICTYPQNLSYLVEQP